jgi:hypothetical protein
MGLKLIAPLDIWRPPSLLKIGESEALALIQGSYSREIIPDPHAFQYMSY